MASRRNLKPFMPCECSPEWAWAVVSFTHNGHVSTKFALFPEAHPIVEFQRWMKLLCSTKVSCPTDGLVTISC